VVTIGPDITAIDMHVHLSDERAQQARPARSAQMSAYFGRKRTVVPVDEMADMYRSRQMMAVIMNSTDPTVSGEAGVPNDYVAEVVSQHPDVFLGFGAIDPWQGRLAQNEILRCKELGLVGIGELNAARQRFLPNDPHFEPIWQTASDAGLPVLFHGGYAAAGSGTPGGGGVKLRYARPAYLDDVAADFPELTIICAHPSWPWQSEALAVAMHKANVFLDISGWGLRYLPEEVRHYMNSRIPTKVLFGTDWPGLQLDACLSDFAALDLKPEVRRRVLLENARELLRSGSAS
jgi:predicted TIM-barrel fold metal-dependent hydrolase